MPFPNGLQFSKQKEGSKNIPVTLKTLIIWRQTYAKWLTFSVFSPFVLCDKVGCRDSWIKGSFHIGGIFDKICFSLSSLSLSSCCFSKDAWRFEWRSPLDETAWRRRKNSGLNVHSLGFYSQLYHLDFCDHCKWIHCFGTQLLCMEKEGLEFNPVLPVYVP